MVRVKKQVTKEPADSQKKAASSARPAIAAVNDSNANSNQPDKSQEEKQSKNSLSLLGNYDSSSNSDESD